MIDFLSRDKIISFLKSVIETQSKNAFGYSFAIDGEWGCGKSWVLAELENQLKLDSKNEKKYESSSTCVKLLLSAGQKNRNVGTAQHNHVNHVADVSESIGNPD